MKIKLSKTLAIALALCLTFAGFSAFAADVAIETSYDYTQAADATVTVKASVKNIAEGSEVTYYVSDADEIVYINQETAGDSGVTFPEFTAPWNKLTASTVVFGSDANWSEGGFTFVPAGNYKTSGNADATGDEDPSWMTSGTENVTLADGTVEEAVSGYSFTAKVSGNYSEYGIKITLDGVDVELPALGCSEAGSYTVFVGGITADDAATAVAYAK